MAGVTWRQHRIALAAVAVFLGAFAVYLWLTGLQIHHAYAAACHPAGSLDCTLNFSGKYGTTGIIVSVFAQAVPALIGAFAGAPVLARELETGTFRYAWTQGFGRLRWTLAKLVLLAVAVTAAAAAFSVMFSWYCQPFFAAGYATPFSTRLFDLGEVAFPAWTLAAFAIGALAGMLIRRVVPAIAATLAAYVTLALATALYLREHYMTPLLTSKPNVPGSAWVVSQWYDNGGKFAFGTHGSQIANAVSQLCPGRPGRPGTSGLSPAQCLTQHGYTLWSTYQPADRFWTFQWIEGGWLLALSALLIAAAIWLVRRRAA
jgi:ABC-type transport system involved in multi-copper enzyme maturation permease subunit